jgi:L-seryl-tRNA(Ser) seleniumtransferase
MGFTHLVTLEELVRLGQDREVPVFDDLGSGCLLDTARFGLQREPMVQESIAAGASLVFSSGDKLLGGPQAGIVLGKEELVRKLQRHPLARAVRIDKVRLAGLAATLSHYVRGEALSSLPVWQMIAAPGEELELRAGRWVEAFRGDARVVEGETMVGGGSLPGGTLPTRLVAIGGSPARVEKMARFLRAWEPPVVGRISEDVLLLDPRTVLPGEDAVVQAALEELSGRRAAHRSV